MVAIAVCLLKQSFTHWLAPEEQSSSEEGVEMEGDEEEEREDEQAQEPQIALADSTSVVTGSESIACTSSSTVCENTQDESKTSEMKCCES